MDNTGVVDPVAAKLQTEALILSSFLLFMWLIHLIDRRRKQVWRNKYGITPRAGFNLLLSLLFSPWLHNDWRHLISNSLPFLILGWLVMLPDTRLFWPVTAVAVLVSGMGIWIFGAKKSRHAGASGVIFGYFGYVLSRGFFQKDTGAVLFALVMAGFYAWLFRLLLSRQKGVSFAGHLWGFVGGIVAAWVIARFYSG